MQRKTIIIACIIGVVIMLVVAFFASRKTEVAPPPTPNPTPTPVLAASPPPVVMVPNAPSGVRFFFATQSFTFPTALPMYQVVSGSAVSPEQAIRQFASSLNLPSPEVSSSSIGTTLYWNSKDYSLSFAQNQGVTTFSFLRLTPGTPGTNQNPASQAQAFLAGFLHLSDQLTIRLVSQNSSVPSGASFTDNPSLTSFLFQIEIGETPVLLANFDPVSAHVSIDTQGVVRSANMTFPPTSFTQIASTSVLGQADVIQSLDANRGLLLSSYGNGAAENGVPPTFSRVQIQETKIAYYFDINKGELLPVYLFGGVGATDLGQTMNVQYLLMATK